MNKNKFIATLILSFLLTSCTNTKFTWGENIISYVSDNRIINYNYLDETQQILKTNGAFWTSIDMTGKETIIALDNNHIMYINKTGQKINFDGPERIVAIKIIRNSIFIVSQFEEEFIISQYHKQENAVEKNIETRITGTFIDWNYIDEKLLISFYSHKENETSIVQINETLDTTEILKIKGIHSVYPVYFSEEFLIYSFNQRDISEHQEAKDVNNLIIQNAVGSSTILELGAATSKSILKDKQLYILCTSNLTTVYSYDFNNKRLLNEFKSDEQGLGMYMIEKDLILVTNNGFYINNILKGKIKNSRIYIDYN